MKESKKIPELNAYMACSESVRLSIQKKQMNNVGIPDRWRDDCRSALDLELLLTGITEDQALNERRINALVKSICYTQTVNFKMRNAYPVTLREEEATADKRRRKEIKRLEEAGEAIPAKLLQPVMKPQSKDIDDDVKGESVPEIIIGRGELNIQNLPSKQRALLFGFMDELRASSTGLYRYARHLFAEYDSDQAGELEGLKDGTAASYRARIQTKLDEYLEAVGV